ncbi:hydroxymethylbilane synthase [Candidatus Hydrogenedentota bacterium]
MSVARCGSRGSLLAMTQSKWVVAQLEKGVPDTNFEIEVISTKGDRILDSPLSVIGGKGLFTKELESAILEKRVSFAVHSLKDLPTELPEGLCVGAVPKRVDSHDVLVSRNGKKLADIPEGATVATSSLRRRAFLLAARPDLDVVDIRGNLDTRLRKLKEQDLDGLILARAGLIRLGRDDEVTEIIDEGIMLSAPGQGALGIECRADDSETLELLKEIHDEGSRIEVEAERSLLEALGGGCQVPLGTRGVLEDGSLSLTGAVASLEGAKIIRVSLDDAPEKADELGRRVADELLKQGAGAILDEICQ